MKGSFINEVFQLVNKEGKLELKYHRFEVPNKLMDLGIAY